MAEFNINDINIQEVKESLGTNRKKTKDSYKQEHWVEIIKKAKCTKKADGTISSYSKDMLIDLLLKGDEEQAPRKSPTDKKVTSMTKTIIESANNLKKAAHGTELNPWIEENAEKALDAGIEMLQEQDESIIDNMGNVGIALGLAGLVIDTLFSTEKLAVKGQEYLAKHTEQEQRA